MRTTVRLDPALMAEARRLATATGRTVTGVIEDALREVVSRSRLRGIPKLTIVDGSGVRPGVDLDDSAALGDVKHRA